MASTNEMLLLTIENGGQFQNSLELNPELANTPDAKALLVTPQLVGEIVTEIMTPSHEDAKKVARSILGISGEDETFQPIFETIASGQPPDAIQVIGKFPGLNVHSLETILTGIRSSGVFSQNQLAVMAEHLNHPDQIAISNEYAAQAQNARLIRAWTRNVLLAPLSEEALSAGR